MLGAGDGQHTGRPIRSTSKSTCFETFPFPDATPDQQARIRALAEQLDAHRKRQQAQHPTLTLTGIYNVLAKIRTGEALTAKDKTIHEHGLVSVLQTLHDELDAAVLAAYGWSDLPASASETLLERLVALNAERAREEAAGHIRWLRPAFQNPQATLAAVDPEKRPKTASTAADRPSPPPPRPRRKIPVAGHAPRTNGAPRPPARHRPGPARRNRHSPRRSPAKARGKNASPTSCKPSSPSAARGRMGKRGMGCKLLCCVSRRDTIAER